ncbi:MAG: glycoside hydrolase family 28 protein [Flavobacteriaceae bacterium]
MSRSLVNMWLIIVCSILHSSCKESTVDITEAKPEASLQIDPFEYIEAIRNLIKPPTFNETEYLITDFGAVGDGKTLNTEAFKKAIEACNLAGGGKVIVPEGEFLTGAIYLKSNVNLHLSASAVITFNRNPKDYPLVLVRWEGMDCMNYSPQIYAYKEENIAVTGKGLINGNASKEYWWLWKGATRYGWKEGQPSQEIARDSLHVLMHKAIAPEKRVFGEGHYLRPYMFQPYQCKNVLISGVKMIDSPMWFVSPVMCENVIIQDLHIDSHGPNTDGVDPDACKNVLIKDCFFNTGDDCIAIKSGRDEDGRGNNQPAENHIIEGCVMKNGHGGIVIGSEIAGGAKNIFVQDCEMDSPHLTRAIRIKTNSSRGGVIDGVYIRNLKIGKVSETLLKVNLFYEQGAGHGFDPKVKNLFVENVHCKSTKFPVFMLGYDNSKIENVHLKNVTIESAEEASVIRNVKHLTFEDVTFQTALHVNEWGSVTNLNHKD